jgi:hypothetical protein
VKKNKKSDRRELKTLEELVVSQGFSHGLVSDEQLQELRLALPNCDIHLID